MEAQLERLEGDRVRLTVEVPAAEVHHAVEHATSDLAERVRVPGFRPGKVPRQVLIQRIGRDRVYSEAVESHIGSWFWNAARSSRLRPKEQPAYGYELPAGDGETWSFTAEFPNQDAVEPADWTKLEVPRLEPEVTDEVVEAELAELQRTVASLSLVEGRLAQADDVAVVDVISEEGPGQRDYVVEVGSERLLPELEDAIKHLLPGNTDVVAFGSPDGAPQNISVTLKELYERVLPPLDDSLATSASEFDTFDELRADIVSKIEAQLEQEADARFRIDAIDELLKASKVEVPSLVVDVRTRDLLNAFIRQLETRGIDPVAYLRAAGVSGADLEQRFREEAANSIGRELVLEGVADKLGIEISDDDIRTELLEDGEDEKEVDEFMEAGGADRVREDLRLKKAVDRVAAEVTSISQELANARESIWTPGKEEGSTAEKTLWTPGGKER